MSRLTPEFEKVIREWVKLNSGEGQRGSFADWYRFVCLLLAEVDALRAGRSGDNIRINHYRLANEQLRNALTASELARAKAVEALKLCGEETETHTGCWGCARALSAQPPNMKGGE